jgi:hypothetical protein
MRFCHDGLAGGVISDHRGQFMAAKQRESPKERDNK